MKARHVVQIIETAVATVRQAAASDLDLAQQATAVAMRATKGILDPQVVRALVALEVWGDPSSVELKP